MELLEQTSLNQLFLFTFIYKTSYPNEEVSGIEPSSPSDSDPWLLVTHITYRSKLYKEIE
jgi:hypothetical protein